MATPLYSTDIIPMTSRPTLTVMDDGDYFVILDTSTGKISKILKTLAMEALKISYDNTTSELTADTVQAALDELVVDLGSSDSAISALTGRLDTLEGTGEGSVAKAIGDVAGAGRTTETVKGNADNIISIEGTGYTEGTLKSHEDRLDTLEGTGEGSVAKAIDDAVSPLAEVVDTNRLYSDSQYLALKAQADAQALEIQASRAELYNGYKILQFGSTDIIGKGTKADYSAIDVSANVVDGNLSMEQKGLTIRNLVDGADIANLGTVTFASILNDKYYDTLNNAILTGTGSNMTATNNSGATANMAIYHLNAHGLQAITDTDILAKLLPYVDGTKNVPKLGLQILDADDAVTQTIFLPAIGNSLPNGVADSIKTVDDGWEYTKRVQEYTLQSADITSISFSGTNVVIAITKNFTDFIGGLNGTSGRHIADGWFEINNTAGFTLDSTANIGGTYDGASSTQIRFGLASGTTLAEAQAAIAGTVIYYQLATPITTHYDLTLPTSGKTIHRFAGEEKIALYGTGLTFSENVLTVLSAIKFVAGEMTDITSLATITEDTVTFSGVSATDVVYVKVEHDADRPLGVLEHTPAVSNTASRLASLEARVSALEV